MCKLENTSTLFNIKNHNKSTTLAPQLSTAFISKEVGVSYGFASLVYLREKLFNMDMKCRGESIDRLFKKNYQIQDKVMQDKQDSDFLKTLEYFNMIPVLKSGKRPSLLSYFKEQGLDEMFLCRFTGFSLSNVKNRFGRSIDKIIADAKKPPKKKEKVYSCYNIALLSYYLLTNKDYRRFVHDLDVMTDEEVISTFTIKGSHPENDVNHELRSIAYIRGIIDNSEYWLSFKGKEGDTVGQYDVNNLIKLKHNYIKGVPVDRIPFGKSQYDEMCRMARTTDCKVISQLCAKAKTTKLYNQKDMSIYSVLIFLYNIKSDILPSFVSMNQVQKVYDAAGKRFDSTIASYANGLCGGLLYNNSPVKCNAVESDNIFKDLDALNIQYSVFKNCITLEVDDLIRFAKTKNQD